MELTIEQALQQGVSAHKEGKLQDAEKLYRAILQSQPLHPDANHNLGILAVSVYKAEAALPLFKTALETNPKIEQFWLSYIDALIKEKQFDNAKQVLEQAKTQGVAEEKLNVLEAQLTPTAQVNEPKLAVQKKNLSFSEKRKKLAEQKKQKKAKKQNLKAISPSESEIKNLLEHYQKGRYDDAEKLAMFITQEFPQHQFGWKVLGAVLKEIGRASESLVASQKSVQLAPQDFEAHSNLGNTLKELGRLEESEANCRQAIALKPDFAEAHNNLGNTLKELGRLDEAEASYKQAIALKFDLASAFWNLHSIEKTIIGAEHWIDKCLIADTTYLEAKLTKSALKFYRGDRADFDNLMQSEFKQNSYMRSFSWVFSLPNLPELHFNKFYFFDAIIKKSITSKPFYEFGVWRASSFKYLIKVFKKGYGFDTFTGLPEEWDVGDHIEKEGTYTSDGNVPKIKGGEFIIGKFEDTLPVFFSESRPMASVINFDADLYSSTICALNFSKSVMDKDTILIFDELIINESWEQDEFKALNEFCSINHFSYEVIAVSFFTKQVAVKLIGI
jgi:tetratricopeptide (TPR) repeat protein